MNHRRGRKLFIEIATAFAVMTQWAGMICGQAGSEPQWSLPQPLNTTAFVDGPTHYDRFVRLANNREGTWMAIWSTNSPPGDGALEYDIVVSRSLDDGRTWEPPYPIASYANSTESNISPRTDAYAAIGGEGDTWIAAWIGPHPSAQAGDFGPLYVRRSSDNGATWEAEQNPVPDLQFQSFWLPGSEPVMWDRLEVVPSGAGTWLIAATLVYALQLNSGASDVTILRSSDAGLSWTYGGVGVPNQSPSILHRNSRPSLAIGGEGNWVMVWSEQSDSVRIMAAYRQYNGTQWSEPIVLKEYPLGNTTFHDRRFTPTIEWLEGGYFAALWNEPLTPGSTSNWRIVASTSSKRGMTWTEPKPTLPEDFPGGLKQRQVNLASDGESNFIAAWGVTQFGSGSIASLTSTDDGALTSAPGLFDVDPHREDFQYYNPDLAASPSGTYIMAWEGTNRYETGYLPPWGAGTDILFSRAEWAGNKRPLLEVTSPAPGTLVAAEVVSVPVQGTANDPDGVIHALEWRLNNGAWQIVQSPPGAWQFEAVGLELGRNVLEVRVQDSGNTYSKTEKRVVVREGATTITNDFFANAIELQGYSGQVATDNRNATKETNEPSLGDGAAGRTLWYSYVAPAYGRVSFETCGSAADTIVTVFNDESLEALEQLARGDDECDLQSKVAVDVDAGDRVYVRLDSFGDGDGAIVLSYEFLHYFQLETSVYKAQTSNHSAWGTVATIPPPVRGNEYLENTVVYLYADPADSLSLGSGGYYPDFRFESWTSGDLLESPYTSQWNRITMTADTAVHARFRVGRPQYLVNLESLPAEGGEVYIHSPNEPIETGYLPNTTVYPLVSREDYPYRFSYWESELGRVTTSRTPNYRVENASRFIKAHFELESTYEAPHPQHSVTYRVNPPGSGSVVPEYEPFAGSQYRFGEVLELYPVPETGYFFHSWSGDADGYDRNTGLLHVLGPSEVVANFSQYNAGDIYEPDDSWDQAKPIPLPREGTLSISGLSMNDNEDWFQLLVPPLAHVYCQINFAHQAGDLQMQLWDRRASAGPDWGRPLAESYRSSPANSYEEIVFVNTSTPRELHLRVYGEGGASNSSYSMKFTMIDTDDLYDRNGAENNSACAELPTLAASTTHRDLVCRDEDWYRIAIPSGATKLHVRAEHLYFSGNIDLMVLDDTPSQCATVYERLLAGGYSTNAGQDYEEVRDVDVTGRTSVLLRVYGADAFSRNIYHLRVDVE